MRWRMIATIVFLLSTTLFGCALGKKEWPVAQKSEDLFKLTLISGARRDNCLLLQVAVSGASQRLYRASIQYDTVGGELGTCEGCPFIPRDVVNFTRDQDGFDMEGETLSLSMCSLDPKIEYRFRVAGKSELPTSPLVYTDIFTTTPQ
ncbi:hypothetical protein [Pseudodesulfovibrio piezophilus]|nr:hypothetical protein [Pseudodesulfovibrio piezophilus]